VGFPRSPSASRAPRSRATDSCCAIPDSNVHWMRAIPRRRRVDELNMRKEFCYSPTVHLVFAFVYLTMTIVILFAGALFLYDTLVPGWFGEYEPRGVRRLVFAVIGISIWVGTVVVCVLQSRGFLTQSHDRSPIIVLNEMGITIHVMTVPSFDGATFVRSIDVQGRMKNLSAHLGKHMTRLVDASSRCSLDAVFMDISKSIGGGIDRRASRVSNGSGTGRKIRSLLELKKLNLRLLVDFLA